jgi:hypothetical protein
VASVAALAVVVGVGAVVVGNLDLGSIGQLGGLVPGLASPTPTIAPRPTTPPTPAPTVDPVAPFTILEPLNGQIIAEPLVIVSGTGPPGAVVTAETPIGQVVSAIIGESRRWQLDVILVPGNNRLAVRLSSEPGVTFHLTLRHEPSG